MHELLGLSCCHFVPWRRISGLGSVLRGCSVPCWTEAVRRVAGFHVPAGTVLPRAGLACSGDGCGAKRVTAGFPDASGGHRNDGGLTARLAFDPRDGMSGRAGRRGVCSGIMMLMAILRYGGNAARFGFCFRNPAVRAAVRAGKQSRSAKECGTEMV